MAYSKDLRERVLSYVAEHRNKAAAARLFKVHEETVRAWVKAFERSGKARAEPPPGRPRKITAEHENSLKAQVESHSDDTLAQHCERWEQTTGVKVGIATMHTALKRAKLMRKKRPSKPLNAMS
ncbi:MAG: transposase [Thermaceae bacterium]|nr:transposase [Thermaceae bacterium]